MKPFNLEEAKAGKPVCTRDGRPVRILCFDKKSTDNESIVALLKPTDKDFEVVAQYYDNGCFALDEESPFDLMMVGEKHEGYINLYRSTNSNKRIPGAYVYNTKEQAIDNKTSLDYITTTKIEWEE